LIRGLFYNIDFRFQIIRDDLVEEFVPDPPIRRGHEAELKQALANEDERGQKTFAEAVLRAKTTDIPELSDLQKAGARGWLFFFGGGGSNPCVSPPPPRPSIFSDHSFLVQNPLNRDDRHLLAHLLVCVLRMPLVKFDIYL
jgi:hypothetical protein